MVMRMSWYAIAPPPFVARWQSPRVARLAWIQPADVHTTCVYRGSTLIRCWADLRAGLAVLRLGDTGPLDASMHPAAHDIYTLDMDGAVARAELRAVVRLPIVRW